MTVALIIVWFFVFGMLIRGIIQKQVLWPQKGEDKDEGGWKEEVVNEQQHDSRRHLADAVVNREV